MADDRPTYKPPPLELGEMVRELRTLVRVAGSLGRNYTWLYGSGYLRPQSETHERTRRDVAGASGDLSAGYAQVDSVRWHLATASEKVTEALACLRGAEKALGRAHGAIDHRQDEPTSGGHEQLSDEQRQQFREAQRQQKRRTRRVEKGRTPWASQEITG